MEVLSDLALVFFVAMGLFSLIFFSLGLSEDKLTSCFSLPVLTVGETVSLLAEVSPLLRIFCTSLVAAGATSFLLDISSSFPASRTVFSALLLFE